ncbi:DUF6252 family protein [Seonamhaeicola marinus]|uniref:Lipocalin-like domain-containing protein n=1 Tax=Seonamhaeicola marinus TaxID=1912246 RepID=A0A5D0HVS6_9FLAO|nr:DUF6252 family protein [Seonamhaeicola marinus]TYA74981.1 hypothetical protein FUA24_16915 [Seonamhaeicola marinus]
MNRKFNYIYVAIVFALISCSGDNNQTEKEFFKAIIENTAYKASEIRAVHLGESIQVSSENSENNSAINFNLKNYQGVGSYAIGDSSENENIVNYALSDDTGVLLTLWSLNKTSSSIGITPGSIEITYDDGKVIEGKFSTLHVYNYHGTKQIMVIKNGSFKADYDF